ncbi:MAG: hypothetical protein ABSG63_02970 [Spirochaetia bacterium]|jgi:hypothetical protein
MGHTDLDGVADILRNLPGVVGVARLDDAQRRTAVRLEAQYAGSSALQIRNLGVELMAVREVCFALLKDCRFRAPKTPTVYLVEEGASENARQVIDVEGTRYAVVGEELIDGSPPPAEPFLAIESSFVIFPERRTRPNVPCTFILPPIPFPELEVEKKSLGISNIISISPSLAADTFVRECFRFPPTNDLATLLIGFNMRGPEDPAGR